MNQTATATATVQMMLDATDLGTLRQALGAMIERDMQTSAPAEQIRAAMDLADRLAEKVETAERVRNLYNLFV